jgi:hypothetical protein
MGRAMFVNLADQRGAIFSDVPEDPTDEDYTWTEEAAPAGLKEHTISVSSVMELVLTPPGLPEQPINVGEAIRTLQQQMEDMMAQLRDLDDLRTFNAQLKILRDAPQIDLEALAKEVLVYVRRTDSHD